MAIKMAVSMFAGFAMSLTSIGQGLAYREVTPSREPSAVEIAPLQLAQVITVNQSLVNGCRVSNGSSAFSREAGTGQRLADLRAGTSIFLTGRVSSIPGRNESWVEFSNTQGGEPIGWVSSRTLRSACGVATTPPVNPTSPTIPPAPSPQARLTVAACAIVLDQVGQQGLGIRRVPSTTGGDNVLGAFNPGDRLVLSTETRQAETRQWVRIIDRRFPQAWISETGPNLEGSNVARVPCIAEFGVREGQQF